MDENRELIYDTGTGYGGEKIYYNKNNQRFYSVDYMWHSDDSMEILGERAISANSAIDIIKRDGQQDSADALRRISALTGIDCASDIAVFDVVELQKRQREYWTDRGPRSECHKHDLQSLSVHPVELYKVNDYWLPCINSERSILSEHERKAKPHREAVERLRALLDEKEKELLSLPVEENLSHVKSAGYTTHYFRDNACSCLYKKILISPNKGIWLKIYYSLTYYFSKYGIEVNGTEYVFDTEGESELRNGLNITDFRLPLSDALIKYLNTFPPLGFLEKKRIEALEKICAKIDMTPKQ